MRGLFLAVSLMVCCMCRFALAEDCSIQLTHDYGERPVTGIDLDKVKAGSEAIKRLDQILAQVQAPVPTDLLAKANDAIGPAKLYLQSLNDVALERDYAIRAGFAALLGKKNLLMIGGGGMAKSMIANLMLANIRFPASMRENFSLSQIVKKRNLFKKLSEQQAETDGWISYATKQLHKETRLSNIFGATNMGKMLDPGEDGSVLEYNMEKSVANYVYVFLDEILDANFELLRALFPLLNERIIPNGETPFPAATQTVFAATNHTLPLAYLKAKKQEVPLEQFFDRMNNVVLIPKKFANDGNMASMETVQDRWGTLVAIMHNSLTNEEMPVVPLEFEHLHALQEIRSKVVVPPAVLKLIEVVGEKTEAKLLPIQKESIKNYNEQLRNNPNVAPRAPYRMTTQFSGRMYVALASSALRTLVIMDWIQKNGQRPLVAQFEDVAGLMSYMGIDGPKASDLKILKAKSHADDDELTSLETIEIERTQFTAAFEESIQKIEEILTGN